MAVIPDITFEDIVNKTKKMLGDNYREEEKDDENKPVVLDEEDNTDEEPDIDVDTTDLEDICNMVIRETAQWTNRFTDDQIQEVMNDCWPVIVKCSCMAYLNRGAEGLGSQSELGQQNVYNDWVAILHKQITNRRYVI